MKLHVAEELRSVLNVEDVRRAIAARNTTDVRCAACGCEIPADSPETVNVVVSENAIGSPLVQFAHERCHPSGFTGRRSDSLIGEGLVARFRVREHAEIPAVLLWEPYQQLRIDREDVHTRFYRWLGLRPSRRGTDATDGPWIQTLTVKLTPARATVALTAEGVKVMARKVPEHPRLSVGEEWDSFPLTTAAIVGEWREAVERTRRCLLVTGTGLGLEHPSLEREGLLLAQGEALAGVAPVMIIANGAGRR
jgi:hypothetical protein